MEKNPLQFRQPKLQKNEEWKPYIRWDKKTDEWIYKAVKVNRPGDEEMEEYSQDEQINIKMNREDLDVIARLIAYMYHDKKDEYLEIASDLRKKHIYSDLRKIDEWLNLQYQQLEKIDEQSKQDKRKYIRA
jgi:hypothetical protein